MFVKTLVATLCVIGVALAEQSLVFLWGVNAPPQPTLQTVPQKEFSDLIKEFLKDHMVVTFQEDALNANDFLCANSETSQSCYAHLQGVETKSYYAGVENPVEAIRSVTDNREFNTVNAQGQLSEPLECQAGKAVFISFENTANQEREASLEAHDSAIDAISRKMACPTVFLYMSTPSTSIQKRSRRSIIDTAAPEGGTYFREGSQFLIFWTHLYLINAKNNAQTEIVMNKMTITNGTDNKNFTVSLATTDAKSVSFNIFTDGAGYQYMSDISYDSVTYRVMGANAPITFSFHCGNLTVNCITAKDATEPCSSQLQWNSLQFEAPFGVQNNETFVFSDSWDCVPFFSPGILMGLFVVILLLVITFVGICWMMDINTMDRFDDPKGKTITISATE